MPDTVALRAEPDTVTLWPPEHVIVYEVTGLPPSEAGAVQVTVTEPSPAVAATPVTAPGAVAGATGVTGDDGKLAELVPTALAAVTKNVYPVPLVSPDTVAVR